MRILIFKEYSTSTFKQFHFSFACRSMKNPTPPTHILFFQLFFFPQTPMKALLLLIKNILFSDACLHLWHLQNLYHKNILHFYFDLQEWKANLLNHCYCFFHGTDHWLHTMRDFHQTSTKCCLTCVAFFCHCADHLKNFLLGIVKNVFITQKYLCNVQFWIF